ncbi:MAG: M15 family metallopeptidase [Leptospiraceae bacterium]|nr:M15 family metallopeptidase [Leptospiraceae bacterium]
MNYLLFTSFFILTTPILAEGGKAIEKEWKKKGLVDVKKLIPKVIVDLKYSGKDNFLGEDMYGDLKNCYLQKEVAYKLKKSYNYLQKIKKGYTFYIYDGARPLRVQKFMWEKVKGTPQQPYVADPKNGSIHNFGSAIDLTLADENGKELDMGTEFDFFGDLAEPRLESKLLKEGKLTLEQIKNRKLLREVMSISGFKVRPNEWWHFNAYGIREVKKKYGILN